ncbi:MAG: DUF1622 domain-containing protein [Verrucomicrobia bacterium]|nr:DUF1622 domain-containing protein [Verrucomicrobiota bacterium]
MQLGHAIELTCHWIAGIMAALLEPGYKGLIILGGLVLIRTIISYFVGRERIDIERELAAEVSSGPAGA